MDYGFNGIQIHQIRDLWIWNELEKFLNPLKNQYIKDFFMDL